MDRQIIPYNGNHNRNHNNNRNRNHRRNGNRDGNRDGKKRLRWRLKPALGKKELQKLSITLQPCAFILCIGKIPAMQIGQAVFEIDQHHFHFKLKMIKQLLLEKSLM